MIRCRFLALAACAVALLGAAAAPATADVAETPIAHSETYNKLLAAFPAGHADSCDVAVVLSGGGGVCDGRLDLVYFYPDGTYGLRPWYVDASSPNGWSVQADPCDGLTSEQYQRWAAYVDYVNGYVGSGPDLTPEQVDRSLACWGWWF